MRFLKLKNKIIKAAKDYMKACGFPPPEMCEFSHIDRIYGEVVFDYTNSDNEVFEHSVPFKVLVKQSFISKKEIEEYETFLTPNTSL
jgi:hypothetical protein